MASPYIHIETEVENLDCTQAWTNLTISEKLYAYYFARASWEGSKVCWFQRSYESPGLFLLFQELFKIQDLKQQSLSAGVSEDEYKMLLAYAAGVYSNMGNYRSFGDTKFIPELPKQQLDTIISLSNNSIVTDIWGKIGDRVYNNNTPYYHLNFPDKNGVTGYYSSNVNSQDAELVKAFLQSKNLTDIHINSRLWKNSEGELEVRLAGVGGHFLPYLGEHQYEGRTIRITNNDFSVYMRRLVDNLNQALPYTANQTQTEMLVYYIRHFLNGEINDHKDSQRKWIRDLGPVIETNIGFIETYVDPLGIRAEFEGFVSIVDKIVSAKFTELVNRAPEIIDQLPWSASFEKDQFSAPDFTSLDVLAFASSNVPIGINIPNYDDIRVNEGFKNVNLGNAYGKVSATKLLYLTESDKQLIIDCYHEGETLAVALHELLGHGSGKLLQQKADGSFNFDPELINPATGEKVDKWYKADETWSSVFGGLSNAYEECRAETIAIYLACYAQPFEVFQIADVERVRNMMWLYMAYAGVKSLLYYSPEAGKWGQAHCQARYVIFRVMLEAPNEFLRVEFTEDQFILHMDYSQLMTTGKEAVGKFLLNLHCYKATADLKRGTELFDKYSHVDDLGLRVREIIVANQKPRSVNLQPHLVLEEHEPRLINYPETHEGLIQSFLERYPEHDQEMYRQWLQEWDMNSSFSQQQVQ